MQQANLASSPLHCPGWLLRRWRSASRKGQKPANMQSPWVLWSIPETWQKSFSSSTQRWRRSTKRCSSCVNRRLPIQSVTRSSSQSSKRSEFGLTKQRLEFGKGVNPTSNGFTKMKSHRLFVCFFKRCTPSAKKVGNANNDICFPSLGSVCLCHQSCHFPTLGSQPCLPVSGQSFVGRPEAKEREG